MLLNKNICIAKNKNPILRLLINSYTMKHKKSLLIFNLALIIISFSCDNEINRFQLVTRHNITHSGIDSLSPLSVGNGEFAFTADITGLQTFPEHFEGGVPLGTMSQWAWHYFPNTGDYTLDDVARLYKVGEDSVPYWYQYSSSPDPRKIEATNWLRANPHRLHLGLIGLESFALKRIAGLYQIATR